MSIRSASRRASRLLMAGLLSLPSASPLLAPAARAQGGQPLLPPSLPSTLPMTLPGGMPLPVLPGGAQQEILQRILDAAGGRVAAPPAPAPSFTVPYQAPPQPPATPFRQDLAEPLSNTEAFFAGRGFRKRQSLLLILQALGLTLFFSILKFPQENELLSYSHEVGTEQKQFSLLTDVGEASS